MPEKTRAFLVVAAQDAAGAERTGAPCVRLCYRVGENGTLQRAQMSMTARGGLMGIYEAPGLAAGQPEQEQGTAGAQLGAHGKPHAHKPGCAPVWAWPSWR